MTGGVRIGSNAEEEREVIELLVVEMNKVREDAWRPFENS